MPAPPPTPAAVTGVDKELPPPPPRAFAAAVLAWAFPGAGHLLLGRWGRAAVYATLVLFSLGFGCSLEGLLPTVLGGSPLETLRTVGTMGVGLPYFLLRLVLDYQGDPRAPGFEYGTAFIVTAGVMNLLVLLDAWDVGRGAKA